MDMRSRLPAVNISVKNHSVYCFASSALIKLVSDARMTAPLANSPST
jgi:hypothetical protein